MGQFTLQWDNTDVLANANAISQRALYRLRDTGGAWISAGFTPANDMAKSVNSADTPSGLTDNKIYEFKIQSICTLSGPSDNDNGIQEHIVFACIIPTLTKTITTATSVINLTGTNISKVKFTLKRSLDNVVMGSSTVNNVANSAGLTVPGLTASTTYYWQIELYATINNVEVVSSSVPFLGAVCGTYPITTDALAICNPTTSLTVTSIEL